MFWKLYLLYHKQEQVNNLRITTIALDHMTLVAVEEGLGTCWIGGFSQKIAKRVLNVPDRYTIAVLLTLGFPKTLPDSKPRKAFEDTVCHESFRE